MKRDRNKEIIKLRESGETLVNIANKYNITRERVRQIVYAHEKKEEKKFTPALEQTVRLTKEIALQKELLSIELKRIKALEKLLDLETELEAKK